jgi:AmiR/NasT family two-component response regulator
VVADGHESLRVLIANERQSRVVLVSGVVVSLGHTVIATSTEIADVGALTRLEHPDVALVGLGDSSEHALVLIDRIVREASCPVIVLLEAHDRAFIDKAAKLGVFAYIVDGDADRLQSTIDITLSRFAEYHALQGAFGRRAVTERAKGILMERHQIGEPEAFDLLRTRARESGKKLVDVSQSVVDGHALLPPKRGAQRER